MNLSINSYLYRNKVEEAEEWHRWRNEIPSFKFPANWRIRIVPPVTGAIVRFLVCDEEGKEKVSVYLDCYDKLGYFGEPYWEIYPYDGDVYRVKMKDTWELLKRIDDIMEGKDKF